MPPTQPSAKALFLNYLALLLLLGLTALASSLHQRALSTSLSIGIAILKALLIALFFMHLNYRSARLRVIASASLVWLAFLIAITLSDYLTRGSIGVLGK